MHPDASKDRLPISTDEVQRLHDQLAPALHGFLKGLLGSEADAADCVQNCFTLLVQRGGDCAPAARRAWLYQVARNQAALMRRQAAVRQRALQQQIGVSEDGGGMADEASAALLAQERREAVQRAVACLPEAQRQVVEMRIRDDLTFQEIATRLKIPLGTALGRMRGALQRLAVLLADES